MGTVPDFGEEATAVKYKTRQRQALLDYFSSVKGQHVTVGDVCAYFQEQGAPIGKTTVYRQVEALAAEGVLRKYVIDESSAACFAFEEETPHCQALHCKCEQCGKLLHLPADTFAAMERDLSGRHGFRLNRRRTVLYGLCEDCTTTGGGGCAPE